MRTSIALVVFVSACSSPSTVPTPGDAALADAASLDVVTSDTVLPDASDASDVPAPPPDAPAPPPDAPAPPPDAPTPPPDAPAPPPDAPAPPRDAPAPPSDAGMGPDGIPASLIDALVGTWATRTRSVTEQTAPGIGMVRTVSNAYGTAVIARAGGGVTLTERACRVVFDRSTIGQTSLDDRAVQSLAALTAPLAFERAGAGWRWRRAARSVAIGWRPMTSAAEPLPMMGSDPRVIDSDGDGNPGVSVRIMSLLVNGSVYVVQAQRSALVGDWAPDQTPRAVNDPTDSTQRTLGASTPLLAQNLPSRVDTTPLNNGVTFARLPAGTECAGLIAGLGTLFR